MTLALRWLVIRAFLCYRSANIETRILQRFDFNSKVIDWADAVFTAGGDGTYLLAASRFFNKDKPLIGLNTDPEK